MKKKMDKRIVPFEFQKVQSKNTFQNPKGTMKILDK